MADDTNPQGQTGAGGQPAGGATTGGPAAGSGAAPAGGTGGAAAGSPPAGGTSGAPATPPEKYEFKLPDGALFQPTAVERIGAYAKARGLSSEDAQGLLDHVHGEVKAHNDALLTQITQAKKWADLPKPIAEAHQQRVNTWTAAAMKDPELAGEKGDQLPQNLDLAKAAVKKFFGDEMFDEVFERTGYGNHPAVLKGFLKIGKAMAGDNMTTGSHGGNTPRSTAEILYDKTPTQQT